MAETNDERRARLEAELRALETQDREAAISQQAGQTGMGDVLGHLVAHSAGYPAPDDREVHARAVRREYGLGEYAPEELEKAKAEKTQAKKAKTEAGSE